MLSKKTLTKCLKTIWGAHHFVFNSKDVADIAAVLNVSPERVVKLMNSPYWDQALHFWNYIPPAGDLNLAQKLWTELVENGGHININLVEYPDKPVKSGYSNDNFAVYALIHSHLSCVDNLTPEDVQHLLVNEDNDGLSLFATTVKTLRTLIIGGCSLTNPKASTARSWHV